MLHGVNRISVKIDKYQLTVNEKILIKESISSITLQVISVTVFLLKCEHHKIHPEFIWISKRAAVVRAPNITISNFIFYIFF